MECSTKFDYFHYVTLQWPQDASSRRLNPLRRNCCSSSCWPTLMTLLSFPTILKQLRVFSIQTSRMQPVSVSSSTWAPRRHRLFDALISPVLLSSRRDKQNVEVRSAMRFQDSLGNTSSNATTHHNPNLATAAISLGPLDQSSLLAPNAPHLHRHFCSATFEAQEKARASFLFDLAPLKILHRRRTLSLLGVKRRERPAGASEASPERASLYS